MKETFLVSKSKSSKVANIATISNQISTKHKMFLSNLKKSSSKIQVILFLFLSFQVNTLVAQNCGETDWNDPVVKATLLGDYHVPGNGCECGPITNLVDSDQTTLISTKSNSFINTPVFTVQFPQATVLTGFEVNTKSNESEPITGGVFRIEGSNDGTNYTSVSIDFTHGGNLVAGAPQYGGTGTLAYTFPFASNTTAYSYYRVYAISMSTRFSRDFTEIYFDYVAFDAQLTNQGCNDNSTFSDYTDDQVTFDFDPSPGVAGNTYSVSVDGGFTISPATGTYGQVTSFTISEGSSGAGDLNVTLTDVNVPCSQVISIPNTTNACIPGACGGTDWNDPANKSTITGIWDVPGTPAGSTTGTLAVLVDGNESSGFGTKSNNFSNLPFIVAEFTEATVLTGIEISCSNNPPINSGTFVVQGSNDGTSYTDVSVIFTHGTNLSAGAPVYGGGSNAYTFPFASNTDTYTHYRIFANTMVTQFGRNFYELSFNYDVFNTELDNVSFGDNATPGVFNDDLVNFELNPSPGTGTYDVQMTGGYSITPSTGTYGQVTSFQISEGSAGTGDLNIMLIDQTVPCVQDITIPNPDLTATVESNQATCASPTDSPLSTITLTATDGVYEKVEHNIGAVYAGTGYATASSVTNSSSGYEVANSLPNPDYTTYYTVRGYASETLYRDFVVSVEPKVCSVSDLSLAVSPPTDSANEGEQLEYTVTLTNNGPDPALNVEVKVDIPAGLELLSASSTLGDYVPGTQLWSADLVPVGSHELTITYRMK